MMKFRITSAVTICAGLTSVALAENRQLAGEALKQVVAGKTVVLNTPVGSIPIAYSQNGTMTGRVRSMPTYMGQERDKGTWWIKADQICQKWDTWLSGRPHCFTVRFEGRVVHWRSTDGRSGTATIASN